MDYWNTVCSSQLLFSVVKIFYIFVLQPTTTTWNHLDSIDHSWIHMDEITLEPYVYETLAEKPHAWFNVRITMTWLARVYKYNIPTMRSSAWHLACYTPMHHSTHCDLFSYFISLSRNAAKCFTSQGYYRILTTLLAAHLIIYSSHPWQNW